MRQWVNPHDTGTYSLDPWHHSGHVLVSPLVSCGQRFVTVSMHHYDTSCVSGLTHMTQVLNSLDPGRHSGHVLVRPLVSCGQRFVSFSFYASL